ncbi:MAG: hypothetical protein K6G47_02440 [Clostridia bacterium]|nr:hypothetical protein [Clostridia bacterium]
MKKNYLTLLILGCFILSGCTNAETTTTVSEDDGVQRTTESYTSISEDDPIDSSVSEEESAAEELAKYDAVFDKINESLDFDEFANADDEKKAEMVIEVLKDIAENGTDEYPYPLVVADSWNYLADSREVEFEFFNGVKSGYVLYDENDPYSTDQTDITE